MFKDVLVLVHGEGSGFGFRRILTFSPMALLLYYCFIRRGGGRRLPRGREEHGSPGGPGPRRGADHALHHHLLLACPGHAVRKTCGEREPDFGADQGRIIQQRHEAAWKEEEGGRRRCCMPLKVRPPVFLQLCCMQLYS